MRNTNKVNSVNIDLIANLGLPAFIIDIRGGYTHKNLSNND